MTPELIDDAKICLQLAQAGDLTAMNSLAWMYKMGMGVSQNDQEAQRWFDRILYQQTRGQK